MPKRRKSCLRLAVFLFLQFAAQRGLAQADLPIYADKLLNGFQDWSWASHSLANTTPVKTGSRSIRVSDSAWTAVSFWHGDFSTAPYTNLTFWAHGGTSGGQRLQITVTYGPSDIQGTTVLLPSALPAGSWRQYILSLKSLGVANRPDVNRISVQLTSFGTAGTFYLDDLALTAAPAPARVHVGVKATNALRTADRRWFGLNTAIWDGDFDTASTSNAIRDLGCQVLRFPGGSLSDEYHWATGRSLNNTWSWVTSWAEFMRMATNTAQQAFITVNYGTGSSNEAAAWVRSANVTNRCGFKYWEIGNECYGSWETDSNSPPHDPYTYAVRVAGYMALMKAADASIKLGVVAAPGENSYSNNAAHPALNPRTGTLHWGWTPVMLSTLKSLGVTPDFLVHHFYPQYTATESDPLLLQASSNWAEDAADLRQQLADYLGSAGAQVELLVTENNSNAGRQGRQSTSIVNALYLADSLASLMKTEFNSFVWWDLRNSPDTTGNFDSSLYGWRTTGDLGIMPPGTAAKYPTYCALKLMQYLVRAGDTVLAATSDFPLLSAYAGLQTGGALTLLVINKDPTTTLATEIALSDFTPRTPATVLSYGIPQDEAVRTNGPAALRDLQTNTVAVSALFTHTFPPYSLTLFVFTPSDPLPLVVPVFADHGVSPTPEGWQLSFSAQAGQTFRLLVTDDLTLPSDQWTVIARGTFGSGPTTLTDSVTGFSLRFYRIASP
ncbi:MAG TPA: alpha-L-arabinofuranosidase [Verrucomicrobiota bacterium]|nr:alpha-L-arabinofuranosidase [Verrucomicrobiota bacterium]HNU52152.1 alpha-L-arabinofuranosidase [Verrucomicrobiota bacterium]